jgi:hypothetical protein
LKEIQEKTNKLPFDRSRQNEGGKKDVVTEEPKKEKENRRSEMQNKNDWRVCAADWSLMRGLSQ